jgi:hypothetical protein
MRIDFDCCHATIANVVSGRSCPPTAGVQKMKTKSGKFSCEPNALLSVVLAIALSISMLPVTYWEHHQHSKLVTKVGLLLYALAYSGLSALGGFCAIRAFVRMKSFGRLLMVPVFFAHLFFFYLGSVDLLYAIILPLGHSSGLKCTLATTRLRLAFSAETEVGVARRISTMGNQ